MVNSIFKSTIQSITFLPESSRYLPFFFHFLLQRSRGDKLKLNLHNYSLWDQYIKHTTQLRIMSLKQRNIESVNYLLSPAQIIHYVN